jgi:hypothetical protein
MRILAIGISLLLGAVVGVPPARAQTHPAPYRYGELQLGMSLAEADALRSDDHVEKCGYDHASTCLVRDDMAFSRKARIVAAVDDATQRLSQIVIETKDFSQRKGYPCWHVLDSVIKSISDTYGAPTCGYRRIKCTWQLPDAVMVETASFCSGTDPSSGYVSVHFTQGSEQK